jgi:hypothetical protein
LSIPATLTVGPSALINAQEIDGIELGEAMMLTAKVVAIDKEHRIVTLRGPKGRVVDLEVGEEAHNFDQVKIGDDVQIAYYESVALYLGEHGKAPEAAEALVVQRAAKGEQPEGLAVGVIDVSAKIVAIDLEKRAVTLELPDGEIVTTPVTERVRPLETLKVGDVVHAQLTKALAISVSKPKP